MMNVLYFADHVASTVILCFDNLKSFLSYYGAYLLKPTSFAAGRVEGRAAIGAQAIVGVHGIKL